MLIQCREYLQLLIYFVSRIFSEQTIIRSIRKCVTPNYVPALCTHRPSLLPIEWFSEVFGLRFVPPLWRVMGKDAYFSGIYACCTLGYVIVPVHDGIVCFFVEGNLM